MKPKVILLIYGSGGHRAQMEKLLDRIKKEYEGTQVKFIGVSESEASIHHPIIVETYEQPPFRNKYFSIMNLLSIPLKYYNFISCFFKIQRKYNVLSIISTGPGLAIPFSVMFKMKNCRIVFIETWSRFETQSYAGKTMYRLADKFYIQNKSLAKFYPKAIYSGLL